MTGVQDRARGISLSPRDLAGALGVSESSVKRWIDAGRLPASVTSGGHRRVELEEALRFARAEGRVLAEPALLGLELAHDHDGERLGERFLGLLRAGEGGATERLLLGLLVSGAWDLATLCDGPLRRAMAGIGALWDGAHGGVFEEHRATRLLLRALERASTLFEPPATAPVAVGGSLAGDPSLLPGAMASAVLRAEGFRAVDLGGDTPAESLLLAVESLDARFVWVSVGFVPDPRAQARALERLLDALVERGVTCAIGGRELHALSLGEAHRALVQPGMRALADLARGSATDGA